MNNYNCQFLKVRVGTWSRNIVPMLLEWKNRLGCTSACTANPHVCRKKKVPRERWTLNASSWIPKCYIHQQTANVESWLFIKRRCFHFGFMAMGTLSLNHHTHWGNPSHLTISSTSVTHPLPFFIARWNIWALDVKKPTQVDCCSLRVFGVHMIEQPDPSFQIAKDTCRLL